MRCIQPRGFDAAQMAKKPKTQVIRYPNNIDESSATVIAELAEQ